MKPILKWAGGKNAILKHIKQYLPSDINKRCYHEPFFGGGALFFDLEPKKGTINDINKRLMKFYEIVKNKPEELIEKCLELEKYSKNEKKYYEFRTEFNKNNLDEVTQSSYFLFFNKLAYNGLYRENSSGEFNVPIGKYINPRILNKNKILEASKILKNIDILNEDFNYILKKAKKGDFCYFDPPYYQSGLNNKFTDYSKEGFIFQDHIKLRDICIELDKRDISFILSNSNAKEIKEIYEEKGFSIITISKKWMISCNASSRKEVNEILVHNISI